MSKPSCVIIGGSHAAVQLAASLRQNGWEDGITMISAESVLPYHRPPLSKTYLLGQKKVQDILIRPQSFYDKNEITVHLGVVVTAIDCDAKALVLADGKRLPYTKLAIVTGARVRKIDIPGVNLQGVCYLRNIQDVDVIKSYVEPGKRAVIVGGGYIGLETAAALRQHGMEVTVLEAMPRILQRVTSPEISAFYARIHQEEGVQILTDTAIEAIHGEGVVQSVKCEGGVSLDADLVVIGVGVVPEETLAEQAGLEVDNGIVVDEYARTSNPDIVAAGDCTYHYNSIYDRFIRLESVQNAADQSKVAAATLCDKLERYRALPWFWSDQYDLKLQIAGLSHGFDQVVVRGDLTKGRKFSAFYLSRGRLLAVDAVNSPKEFTVCKQVLVREVYPDPKKLADAGYDIRGLLEL